MASDYGKSLYNDYETLLLKYEKITEENKILKKEHALLEQAGHRSGRKSVSRIPGRNPGVQSAGSLDIHGQNWNVLQRKRSRNM